MSSFGGHMKIRLILAIIPNTNRQFYFPLMFMSSAASNLLPIVTFLTLVIDLSQIKNRHGELEIVFS